MRTIKTCLLDESNEFTGRQICDPQRMSREPALGAATSEAGVGASVSKCPATLLPLEMLETCDHSRVNV